MMKSNISNLPWVQRSSDSFFSGLINLSVIFSQRIWILALAALLFTFAMAPQVYAQATGRVAILDTQRAIFNTEEAKRRVKLLHERRDFADHRQKLENLVEDFNKLQEKFDKDQVVMGREQIAEHNRTVEALRKDITYQREKIIDSEKEVLQELLNEMQPGLEDLIQEIIEEENIGLLLDRRVVLYAEDAYNITTKLTERLNERANN